jgi:hypothetical protein
MRPAAHCAQEIQGNRWHEYSAQRLQCARPPTPISPGVGNAGNQCARGEHAAPAERVASGDSGRQLRALCAQNAFDVWRLTGALHLLDDSLAVPKCDELIPGMLRVPQHECQWLLEGIDLTPCRQAQPQIEVLAHHQLFIESTDLLEE